MSYGAGCEPVVLTRRALAGAVCFAATKVAICRNVRKSSISSSSNDTRMEKCSSSEASSWTNMRESTMPAVNKSTSAAGTSICRRSANSWAIRASRSRGSRIRQLPVLGGEEVVQETVVGPAVDPMAAPLAPDILEAELLQPATSRNVDLDSPGTDRFEPQLREPERQQLRGRAGSEAAVSLASEHGPHRGRRLEAPIHVRQAHHADRQVAAIGRERTENVQVALGHHLERNRRRAVHSVSEVQPLVVFLLAQPVGHELDQLGAVQRQELHSCINFPLALRTGAFPFLRRVRATAEFGPRSRPSSGRSRVAEAPRMLPACNSRCEQGALTCIRSWVPRALSWSAPLEGHPPLAVEP